MLRYNRLLTYNIFKYHNDKKNTIATLNNDFKTLTRTIKLLVLDENDELRYKFSSLQIALGDLEKFSDDLNEIKTKREIETFIPYEQLLDIRDILEKQYNDETNKLPDDIKQNGLKHSNSLFQLHQLLIAIAINVWDYPSRLDKYDMKIINNTTNVKQNNNYVLQEDTIKFIFNNDKKNHKPLTYGLNAKPILELNKRLNKLLKYSLTVYPRKSLFISSNSWFNQLLKPVKDDTVSSWIKDLVPNKHLGVATFRSSFVSYYYPKSNNREKEVMRIRMRTSRLELERAYLKFYTSPEQLVKVKIEPSNELIDKANSGKSNNPIIVNSSNTNDNVNTNTSSNINVNIPSKQVISSHKRKRLNAKKWYEENKQYHKDKVNQYINDPNTVIKRYIRELNNG